MSEPYTKRELDVFFREIKDQLDRIEAQTTKTNGRVTTVEDELEKKTDRIEKVMLVVGVIVGMLLFMNGSELLSFLKIII